MAALPSITPEELHTEAHTEAADDHGPELLGLTAEGWVYAAISIFFVIAIFVFKAHRKVTEALDERIAKTRKSLDEAEAIRAEAEALLADAKRQQQASVKDAEEMIAHAKVEADQIVENAKAATTALIERRKAMAEQKIASAERAALDELRSTAATAAATAARKLIVRQHGEDADSKLVDDTISAI